MSILYPGYTSLYIASQDAGAPVGQAVPEMFSSATPAVSISEGSDTPYGTALFASFILSPPGQAIWNGLTEQGSPLPDVPAFSGVEEHPAPPPIPDGYVPVKLGDLQAVRAQILELMGLTE